MNQEQVTTENTEEKAAEVTTQSETTQQPEEAIRPKGKWFGRGIYGSKDVPIRILDGLIGDFQNRTRRAQDTPCP